MVVLVSSCNRARGLKLICVMGECQAEGPKEEEESEKSVSEVNDEDEDEEEEGSAEVSECLLILLFLVDCLV